jgi:peptidoglycan/xylan/chitin deacetylase (PgdA/CDA1 family)
MNPPKVEWPGGARIALSIVLNYEEGSEATPYYGDKKHEMIGDLESRRPPEVRDPLVESIWEYGGRAGVWRLMRILKEREVKATFFVCAMALENNPPLGPEIVAQGHDVCGHGYRWIEQWNLDREAEKESVHKAVVSIEKTTGRRPYGWWTKSGPSLSTREILAEEGFLYDCDSLADDLPYYTQVKGKPWLVVPYALDSNDGKFWRYGWDNADDLFQYLRDSFDLLYREGATHPRMLSVGIHTRVSGRPGRAVALERFLDHVKRHDGVWFAGRDEIARWWLEHYPPEQ